MNKPRELNEYKLDELIPIYASDKDEEKRIKDRVKQENDLLKEFLRKDAQKSKDGKSSAQAGGFVVTLSIEDNSSMNEEKLIEWLKVNNLSKGIVKKREYVDDNALEAAIYSGAVTQEQVVAMEVCKEPSTKEVLRIKKCKEGK